MNSSDRERLLRELLGDASLEQARSTVLTRGLQSVRRRKQRQALIVSGGGSLALALLLALVMHSQSAPKTPDRPTEPAFELKIITDEQLIALFPGRSPALVGAVGEQRLLFLDAANNGPVTAR